jgi:hypothetical protein
MLGRAVSSSTPTDFHPNSGQRGAQEGQRSARRLIDDAEDPVARELRLGLADGADGADDLPHVGAADKPGAAAGRAVLERDERVLVHPEGFVDEAVAGAGERELAVRLDEESGWERGGATVRSMKMVLICRGVFCDARRLRRRAGGGRMAA